MQRSSFPNTVNGAYPIFSPARCLLVRALYRIRQKIEFRILLFHVDRQAVSILKNKPCVRNSSSFSQNLRDYPLVIIHQISPFVIAQTLGYAMGSHANACTDYQPLTGRANIRLNGQEWQEML